jgi:hypothetical protein
MQLQALLVSGGSDGLLVLWSADHGADSRELVPKLSLKVLNYAHSFIQSSREDITMTVQFLGLERFARFGYS